MKAVNLLPADARRGRPSAGLSAPTLSLDSFSPAYLAVGIGVIVVLLVLMRVLADNTVKNREATLGAVQGQVATEAARADRLSSYVQFVDAAQQREAQVRTIAEQRFDWKGSLDALSRALPSSTSLTSLSATTTPASTTTSTTTGVSGPTFTLAGCANTPNQNGVATLLRRLGTIEGVTNVGFENSTREADCGNSFGVVLTFAAPGGGTASTSTAAAATTSTASATTTTTQGTK